MGGNKEGGKEGRTERQSLGCQNNDEWIVEENLKTMEKPGKNLKSMEESQAG